MIRIMYSLFCSAGLVILLAMCAAQEDSDINVTRLSDRAIVFDGLETNVTALLSSEGIVIVDTHCSPSIMAEIKKLIRREFGRDDITYVINTHGHSDHSGGNQACASSTIVGHQNCREFMLHSPTDSPLEILYLKDRLSRLNTRLGEVDRDSPEGKRTKAEIRLRTTILHDVEAGYRVAPPSVTFRDRYTLQLRDLTLNLIYCGRAHTDNDILVHVPEEGLLLTGDVFSSRSSLGFSVNRMADVPRFLSSLDEILQAKEGIKHVIPGHGRPFAGSDIAALRDLVKEQYAQFEGKRSAAHYLEKVIEKSGIDSGRHEFGRLRARKTPEVYFLEEELSTLGGRLLGRGMVDEAIEVFKMLIQCFPNSALAYDDLGRAYVRKRAIEPAIDSYEKSLKIFPQNKEAQRALEMLRAAK